MDKNDGFTFVFCKCHQSTKFHKHYKIFSDKRLINETLYNL